MALGMRRLRLARSRYTDFWRGKADKSDGISTQSRYTLPCVPDTTTASRPKASRTPSLSRPKAGPEVWGPSMSPWLTWAEGPWNTQLFAAEGRLGGCGGRLPTANKGWEGCHRQPNRNKWSPSPGGRARGTTRSGPGGVGRFRSTGKAYPQDGLHAADGAINP